MRPGLQMKMSKQKFHCSEEANWVGITKITFNASIMTTVGNS